jgi:hypothetical protein
LTQLERLREIGQDNWLAEQTQRWQCGYGEKYSWYEETCTNVANLSLHMALIRHLDETTSGSCIRSIL